MGDMLLTHRGHMFLHIVNQTFAYPGLLFPLTPDIRWVRARN
jgi:hypothetical protein